VSGAATGAVRTLRVSGVADGELAREAKAAGLALRTEELRRIATELGRDPTLVEAHAFDAQWSEHCSYKSSRAFLGRLPTTGPDVLLGVGQDAGIVRLGEWNGETYGIVVAHESHNHPSQVVPFEGAATGIGGIVRDVLCMGAHLIAVADPLRFGPLAEPHCRYVAQGVVDGIAAYGNAIGVPNVAGDVYFHDGFRDNCLVNVVALGVVKARDVVSSVAPPEAVGWDIVLVGKATDRSGFGGAAFSSLVLDDEDREANRGAVQVPDPFLKNVVMRATYRATEAMRAAGIAVGFKDLGAGGIMGCSAELVGGGGLGARIDLGRCPTAQDDLPPEVIAIGETQERLTWVVPPSFTPTLLRIYNEEFGLPQIARGACAAVVGVVTREPRYVLRHRDETVMDVSLDFLTSGVRYERPYAPARSAPRVQDDDEAAREATYARVRQSLARVPLAQACRRVLAHPDVCSRRPIFERYDSVVRGCTAVPAGEAEAGVVLPIPGSTLGAALAVGGNPRYGLLDARYAAMRAVLEVVQKVTAVGARPAALTDCLNFGNPEDPAHMGEFVAAVDGLAEAARAFDLPYVSGNVSLYNQSTAGRAVPASPIVACVGVLADASRLVTTALHCVAADPVVQARRSTLYRLRGGRRSLAGSVAAEVLGLEEPALAEIDLPRFVRLGAAVRAAIEAGYVTAAADISDGGPWAAMCKMAFAAREHGESFDLSIGIRPGCRAEAADVQAMSLFDEGGGFVLEVPEGMRARFAALLDEHGVRDAEYDDVAEVSPGEGRVRIGLSGAGGDDLTFSLEELHESWAAPLRDFYAEGSA